MESAETIPQQEAMKTLHLARKTSPLGDVRQGKSRVTNGSKLLPLADGRSATARRFRDIYEEVCGDLGGIEHLSEAERQLARRAAALSAEAERQEALWSRGEAEFDIAQYTTLANALRRLVESLGLRRVPREVGPPTLADISRHIKAERQGGVP